MKYQLGKYWVQESQLCVWTHEWPCEFFFESVFVWSAWIYIPFNLGLLFSVAILNTKGSRRVWFYSGFIFCLHFFIFPIIYICLVDITLFYFLNRCHLHAHRVFSYSHTTKKNPNKIKIIILTVTNLKFVPHVCVDNWNSVRSPESLVPKSFLSEYFITAFWFFLPHVLFFYCSFSYMYIFIFIFL